MKDTTTAYALMTISIMIIAIFALLASPLAKLIGLDVNKNVQKIEYTAAEIIENIKDEQQDSESP